MGAPNLARKVCGWQILPTHFGPCQMVNVWVRAPGAAVSFLDVVRANCLFAAGRRADAITTITPATPIVKALWPSGSHYAARTDAVMKLTQAAS